MNLLLSSGNLGQKLTNKNALTRQLREEKAGISILSKEMASIGKHAQLHNAIEENTTNTEDNTTSTKSISTKQNTNNSTTISSNKPNYNKNLKQSQTNSLATSISPVELVAAEIVQQNKSNNKSKNRDNHNTHKHTEIPKVTTAISNVSSAKSKNTNQIQKPSTVHISNTTTNLSKSNIKSKSVTDIPKSSIKKDINHSNHQSKRVRWESTTKDDEDDDDDEDEDDDDDEDNDDEDEGNEDEDDDDDDEDEGYVVKPPVKTAAKSAPKRPVDESSDDDLAWMED